MPELLAKTADGQTCVLKVEGGEVTLYHERGVIGKTLVRLNGFKLSQVVGVQRETGVSPYRNSERLTVRYLEEGEEREVSVFSRSAEGVGELHSLVEQDIQRRMEALKVAQMEFRESREAHLNLLQLDLELAESLFVSLEGLHGGVDWVRAGETLDQILRIEAEREALSGVPTVRLGFEGFRSLVSRRRPVELKSEVADALDTLYRGVVEASRHSPRWFSRRLSYLMVCALYRAWDIRLVELVGGEPWMIDDGLSQAVGEVRELVLGEAGVLLPEPQGFEDVRRMLYEAVELLLGVELSLDITTVDVIEE
jgi:hypothetical protein